MRTAKNENDLNENFRDQALAGFRTTTELKASGWAGMSKKGRLVDRRKDPEAAPIKGCRFLGFAEPKTDDELKAALSNEK